MIEQQLEERFRQVVAGEPPLGFDPDEIVDRAARQQRNRRAVVSAVALAVVAVTVTTITVAGSDTGSPQVGTSTSASPPPTVAKQDSEPRLSGPEPCSGSADTPEARAAAAAMAKIEPQLLADHVPDLRFEARCDWLPSRAPFQHVERQYTTITPEDGDLVLRVRHVTDGLDLAGDRYPSYTPWAKESEDVLADGSYLRVYTSGINAPPPTHEKQVALPSLVAVNIRPDGVVVEATFGVHFPGPGLQDWVLEHRDAAIALATDPRLTY